MLYFLGTEGKHKRPTFHHTAYRDSCTAHKINTTPKHYVPLIAGSPTAAPLKLMASSEPNSVQEEAIFQIQVLLYGHLSHTCRCIAFRWQRLLSAATFDYSELMNTQRCSTAPMKASKSTPTPRGVYFPMCSASAPSSIAKLDVVRLYLIGKKRQFRTKNKRIKALKNGYLSVAALHSHQKMVIYFALPLLLISLHHCCKQMRSRIVGT